MRYLILSDIHANVTALEAALRGRRRPVGQGNLCLGDVVGYGPDPNEVIDRIRKLDALRFAEIMTRRAAASPMRTTSIL